MKRARPETVPAEQHRAALVALDRAVSTAREAIAEARQAHRDWREAAGVAEEALDMLPALTRDRLARRLQAAHARAARTRNLAAETERLAIEAQRLKRQRSASNRAIARILGVSRKRVPALLGVDS